MCVCAFVCVCVSSCWLMMAMFPASRLENSHFYFKRLFDLYFVLKQPGANVAAFMNMFNEKVASPALSGDGEVIPKLMCARTHACVHANETLSLSCHALATLFPQSCCDSLSCFIAHTVRSSLTFCTCIKTECKLWREQATIVILTQRICSLWWTVST